MVKLFFQPAPTYQSEFENALPEKEELILYFIQEFYPAYRNLSDKVKESYRVRLRNMEKAMFGRGKIQNTLSSDEYNRLHSLHLLWNDYYSLLLTAAKNRHGIWLNDYIKKQFYGSN